MLSRAAGRTSWCGAGRATNAGGSSVPRNQHRSDSQSVEREQEHRFSDETIQKMHNRKHLLQPISALCVSFMIYSFIWHMWSNCFLYPISVRDMIAIRCLFISLTSFILNRVILIRFCLDRFYNKSSLGRFYLTFIPFFIILWLFNCIQFER